MESTPCSACGAALGANVRFCPECGRPVALDSDATLPTPVASPASVPESSARRRPSSRSVSPASSAPPSSDGIYGPGTLFAQRYRIVGLLGRGGMGEVYRADDLTLGQSVALKFLPDAVAGHADRRTRFTNEVRTAREVAHPNVCRVYDIGEVDGRVYLSMEYIDGEDLSSLLRRIGRLPQEKAIEIARQLCAGIGALHDRNVLHRDLKPANVMIDGRGRVRITDFGLSGVATEIVGNEARAGTPAYMAPEQLAGERADERSDVYALGLTLYEVFTGKRAFEAGTVAEIARLQRESTPASPSTVFPDLDPAIERVLLRCLEADPERRPSSAFAVAAALPGGDPLAAALAAGEVPSIEMVAAAGKTGRVRPLVGVACLLAAALGVVLYSTVGVRRSLHHWENLDKAPAVLQERAREILASAGWTEPPADELVDFGRDPDVLRWIVGRDSTVQRWDRLRDQRPGAMRFWYRRSPQHLVPRDPSAFRSFSDPPQDIAGMARVELDARGRLVSLSAVPAQRDSSGSDSDAPEATDWKALIVAAGFDPERLTATEPEWVPETYADGRRAWKGNLPEDPDVEFRLEAAAYRGRPVYFEFLGPWSRPDRMPTPVSTGDFAVEAILILLLVAILVSVVALAVRHVRTGRGDQVGARRLSLIVLGLSTAGWLLGANHGTSPATEINMFFSFAAMSLLAAALFWSAYLALEPFVRSTWPRRIVGWSRLLTGRWRDPLVGRDILAGAVFFFVTTLIDCGRYWVLDALQMAGPRPRLDDGSVFLGVVPVLAVLQTLVLNAAFNAMFFFLLLLLLRMVFRRTPLAIAAYIVLFAATTAATASGGERIAAGALGAVTGTVFLIVLLRYGLLAFVAGFLFRQIVHVFPMTLDSSAWYSGTSGFAMMVVVGLTLFGAWIGTSGSGGRGDPYAD